MPTYRDEVVVLPGEKTAQVRSIQKHDQDFETAGVGERTGIALKGIEVEDLDRGTILTNDKSIKQVSSLQARAKLVKYWPAPLKEGLTNAGTAPILGMIAKNTAILRQYQKKGQGFRAGRGGSGEYADRYGRAFSRAG